MTRFEYDAIIDVLDNLERREKAHCARYIELNPDDRKAREHDRDIYLSCLHEVSADIRARVKKSVA